MITLPTGIVLFGLCVLGLAVATAIRDARWLQRKAQEATAETTDRQDALPKAA